MCYVGRLKGSIYWHIPIKCEAGSQKNTKLDLRNAASSLQIEEKGVLPGDPYHGGSRNTEHETIYIYTYIFCMYMYTV